MSSGDCPKDRPKSAVSAPGAAPPSTGTEPDSSVPYYEGCARSCLAQEVYSKLLEQF